MKQNSSVTIVDGFLPVDQWPANLNLPPPCRRIGLITSTFDPSVDGSFRIDTDLILEISTQLCEGLDIEVCFWRESETFHDLDDASFKLKLSDDIFETLTASANGKVRVQIWGACWYRIGGPIPYHDSATLEIFCPEENFLQTLKRIQSLLRARGHDTNLINGSRAPKRKSFLLRLLSRTP